MKISLLDFIKTGKFGTAELGQTTQWINNNFAVPDSKNWIKKGTGIWLYGALEFHFFDDILRLIWCDNLSELISTEQFILDRSILDHTDNYFPPLCSYLAELNIQYEIIEDRLPDGILEGSVRLDITGTTTELFFLEDMDFPADKNKYWLNGIGSSNLRQK